MVKRRPSSAPAPAKALSGHPATTTEQSLPQLNAEPYTDKGSHIPPDIQRKAPGSETHLRRQWHTFSRVQGDEDVGGWYIAADESVGNGVTKIYRGADTSTMVGSLRKTISGCAIQNLSELSAYGYVVPDIVRGEPFSLSTFEANLEDHVQTLYNERAEAAPDKSVNGKQLNADATSWARAWFDARAVTVAGVYSFVAEEFPTVCLNAKRSELEVWVCLTTGNVFTSLGMAQCAP